MDTGNSRPTQGATGDPTMESRYWRAQPQRKRIVNKIIDILKRYLPFSKYERLQELKKIAERVEEEIYTAATSQSEYSRKICFMMLTMETRLQSPVRSNSAALYNSINTSVPLNSTGPTGNPNGGEWQEEVYQKIKDMKDLYLLESTARNPNGEDWQEEVYQKIKAMQDLYLLDLNDMYQKVLSKLQQHVSLPQQPKNELVEKLKVFKNMLERFMQFLQIPKHGILANYKDKLGSYEKAIINVITSNRRKPVPPQQQALSSLEIQMNLQGSMAQMLQSNKMPIQQPNQQSSASLLPTQLQQSQQLQQQVMPHMQSHPVQLQQQVGMQQQPNLLQRDMQQMLLATGGFQQQSVIDQQKQLFQQQEARPEASSSRASLDFTAQTGNPNGGDWQEEVYQKIKAMKDLYLLDLNGMHQKVLSKLQQHESLPQQPKNDQLEKLKIFKNMLERFMQFLEIPKHGILPNYKDKLGTYENQIINVINSNRWKPAPPQQQAQALPPPHMQSLQQSQQTHSQSTQVHSFANLINLQGPMANMLQSNKMPIQQQNQQRSASLLPTQVQQSQQQLQQQVMTHLQSQPVQQQVGASGNIGDPTMEFGDWRAQLQADSRQRIVYKILDTLKRHLPFSGDEGLQELNKIAVRFEEKIYTGATSQSDYLRKISLKMLATETRSQNPMSDPMQSNSTANSANPSDLGIS